jgi:hypothetical protein
VKTETQELIYGVAGQTLAAYPPEWADGVPSSVTVKVFEGGDSNDDTEEWTVAGSADTVATTVNTASGCSSTYPNRVYLASLSGVVLGRTYRLANGAGQAELVTVKNLCTTYVLLDRDLGYDYAITTSTFKGLMLSAAVDTTWQSDEANILSEGAANYRVQWAYTLNSLARVLWTYCRLVRQPWRSGVTVEDLRAYRPDLSYSETPDDRGSGFARQIAAAEAKVRVDLLAADMRPDSVRDTDLMRQLTMLAFFSILGQFGNAPPTREPNAYAAESEAAYQRMLSVVVRGAVKIPVDTGAEGGITRQRGPGRAFGDM